MSFKIAIPTYNRYNTINQHTLKCLENIPFELIYIFVANETEYELYKVVINPLINIIIGELGIKNQRNFISNYFDVDDIIISLDDDIEKFIINPLSGHTGINTLFYELANYCNGLIGFPPTSNKFFSKDKSKFQNGLYFAVGVCHIYKNRRYSLTLDICEDYERTCQYYLADGVVSRYNWLLFKTKYWNPVGGISSARNATNFYTNVAKLKYLYPTLVSTKTKFIKQFNCDVYNPFLKKSFYNPICILPELPSNFFNKLITLLSNYTISIIPDNHRRKFPKHRAECYGLTRGRLNGIVGLSRPSVINTEIWEEILRIGDIITPFIWTSCHLNNNVTCPPHKDDKNVGDSLLVSFGDYTGSNIVVNNVLYNAKNKPLLFNGAENEHYNTDDLVGNKYSLIYYISSFNLKN